MAEHPMQPVVFDKEGVARFKVNAIVRAMLDFNTMKGWMDLNAIAILPFTDEDRVQFAQLIGYSVSGAGDLDYFPEDLIAKADAEVERLMKEKTDGHV